MRKRLLFGVVLFVIGLSHCRKMTDLRIERTTRDLYYIAARLADYKRINTRYPEVARSSDLKEILKLRLNVQDAWGAPYRYELSRDGQHYRLMSAGKDRAFAIPTLEPSSDDIVLSDGIILGSEAARKASGVEADRR